IGTISVAAARQAGSVTAIEENPVATRLAGVNARINGSGNVRTWPGRVEEGLRQVRTGQYQAAVLDPPRAGGAPAALAARLRLALGLLVCGSCGPTPRAGDVSLLVQGGYRVRRAIVVDMFPHTYHVESVVLLGRSAG